MRRLVILSALVAMFAGPAIAQAGWQDYTYADAGFLASFPAEPKMTTATYKGANGTSVPEKIYSVTQDSRVYSVSVADFAGTPMTQTDAIKYAVEAYRAQGRVIEDQYARIGTDFGRNLNIAGKDKSHTVVAIFFSKNKLYQIAGVSLPADKDPQSNAPARFKESLSFVGDTPAGGAGGGGAGGAGGRRGGGAGGRRGAPADGAPQPAP